MAMADAISGTLNQYHDDAALQGVLLDHAGDNFSYGASIPEHLPDTCAAMLAGMHGMINALVAFPLPILVAIRGYCLGGGLELASAGTILFAAPTAQLGQPEIKLAVFAPTASVLLPERIGQARADELLLSGRTVDGIEAQAIGLVTAIADDPGAAAFSWFDEYLAPRSAPALRAATKAARHGYVERVAEKLAWVESYYLDGLMRHEDPVEGLKAFMEKRPPLWRHR
ncbi:MAG: cyclohexa-1,5-dienecarbonyl-CoA hydratase [Alphaproteobacteria bacterium]|jgi:cyclohexa-1,5-dienecarbonyl-CoA hydratase